MIILKDESRKMLKKYNIEYEKLDDANDLLDKINDIMVSFVDENDEPLSEFLELEKIYDEIYDDNI